MAVISTALLAACAQPDTELLDDSDPAGVVNDAVVSPKAWSPTTFDSASDIAEANDLETFFRHFNDNSVTLFKGEFETTEEHEERISHADAFGSFATDQPYAIIVAKGTQLRYWADNEVFYQLGDRLCSYFDFPYTIDRNKETACAIGKKSTGVQEYYGESVSGMLAEMAQASEIRFHFVVSTASPGISKSPSVPGAYHLKGGCAIERHRAEALSGNLGLAYVITLNKPSMVGGPRSIEGPSSDPRQVTFYEGIDVDVSGYICYELGTNLIVDKVLY